MLVETMSQAFRRVRQANTTDSSFPDRVPTATKPSGIGDNAAQASASAVFDLAADNFAVQNALVILPYGTGSNGNTFSLRVTAWRELVDPTLTPLAQMWIPVLLCELQATLDSGLPGLTNGLIGTAMLFAKTLTLTTGNANVSVETLSPATTKIAAHAVVDMKGARKLEITFTTGGSATDCNALVALL